MHDGEDGGVQVLSKANAGGFRTHYCAICFSGVAGDQVHIYEKPPVYALTFATAA